jgi:hypothetical protein
MHQPVLAAVPCDENQANKARSICVKASGDEEYASAEKWCGKAIFWANTCAIEASEARAESAYFEDVKLALTSGVLAAFASHSLGHNSAAKFAAEKTILTARIAQSQDAPTDVAGTAKSVIKTLTKLLKSL